MKIKNISKGPRGVNTEDGPVLIEPGQTVDVDLSSAETKVSKATGWFEFGASAKDDDDDKPTERDELKKQADELGLQYPGNISNVKLKELIDAKLAE